MFGSAVLEVAIGLIFIYTVLSVVSSMIQEGIAQWLDWRSKMLAEGIERLLLDTNVRQLFYEHPLIRSLQRKSSNGKKIHPSAIPIKTFSTVVFDIAESLAEASAADAESPAAGDSTEPTPGSAREAYLHIRSVVADLPQSSFRTTLQAFLRVSEADVESFKASVEGWFEATMGEVSNWYKQRSQAVVLVLSVVLSVAGNIDTVALADALWTQPTVRDSLTAIAETYVSGNSNPGTQSLKSIQSQISALNLPLGWQGGFPSGPADILSKILGLLLTSFAVSLGAQFWFGLLKKAVQLRKPVQGQAPKPST